MLKQEFENENDLISGLRAGDELIFARIFKLYWHKLYVHAYSKVQSQEAAEEIVQDLLVSLWEKRNTLLLTNLSHYLTTALKNRCIDFIRKKATQQRYFDYCKRSFPSFITQPEHLSEIKTAIDKGISSLPAQSRQIFIMNRIEGVPNEEIAKINRLSLKAVEYHLTKSIKQMRIYLKDYLTPAVAVITANLF